MSHLNFKSLFAKNFRSIDNVGLKIDYNSGTTTLVASNDNGSGKSTIWRDALFYVLFDKPYAKGQTKTQLINSRSGNNSLVRLEFDKGGIEYIVERGQKPSVFNIVVDGEALNKEAVNFQQVLLDILGADEKLFANSVILGADKFVPFTTMGAEERRKFGDQMLDLIVITSMSAINKERAKGVNASISATNQDLAVLETNKTGVENIISVKKRNAEEVQAQIQNDLEVLQLDVTSNANDLAAKQLSLSEVDTENFNLSTQKTEIEVQLASEYTPKIKAAKEAVQRAESVTNEELSTELLGTERMLQSKREAVQAEERTQAEQKSLFNEQFNTRNKFESVLVDLKTKLSTLVEPNADEPCDHCGGVVGENYFQKHLNEYETKRTAIEAGIVKAEQQVQKGSGLESQLADWETTAAAKMDELKSHLAAIEDQRNEIKIQIASFESEKRNTVLQAQAELTSVKNQLSSEMMNRLNDINQKINDTTVRMRYLKDDIARIGRFQASTSSKISEKQRHLKDAKANSAYADDESSLVELNLQITTAKSDLDALYVKQKIHNLLINSLKDDGIKAKLVENYLPYINERINFYLEKMNFFVRIELSSEYELEMFAPERKGQSIHCLSAGQQKRIDIAVLLAWRDLARQASTNSCNLLILDEILESLSESGAIDFMEMWRSIDESKFTNLVVVTQRKAEFEPMFDTLKMYKLVDMATVEEVE